MDNLRGHKLIVVGLMVAVGVMLGCQKKGAKTADGISAVKGLERIHFDFDRSAVKSEYKSVLEANAAWLKSHEKTGITIEGHCDERGSTEYNIALGWRRAQATKDYLVSLGANAKGLSTKSYGEERPLCTQSDESCWWKNRRADFVK